MNQACFGKVWIVEKSIIFLSLLFRCWFVPTAVFSTSLDKSPAQEHALDQTWRFLLELVGLFERLEAEEELKGGEAAPLINFLVGWFWYVLIYFLLEAYSRNTIALDQHPTKSFGRGWYQQLR